MYCFDVFYRVLDSDDEGSGLEDDTNKELIADIFGSSDEEEEFGGFGDLDIEQSQKPRKESKEAKKQNQCK